MRAWDPHVMQELGKKAAHAVVGLDDCWQCNVKLGVFSRRWLLSTFGDEEVGLRGLGCQHKD